MAATTAMAAAAVTAEPSPRTWVRAGRRTMDPTSTRTSPRTGPSPARPTQAPKRTRQATQEEGESGRPLKRSRWEPSPARRSIPFAVALAEARATAAVNRASQPPPAQTSPPPALSSPPLAPTTRPSWPPSGPMSTPNRAYFNFFAFGVNNLAPECGERADSPPVAEPAQQEPQATEPAAAMGRRARVAAPAPHPRERVGARGRV